MDMPEPDPDPLPVARFMYGPLALVCGACMDERCDDCKGPRRRM